MVGTFRNVQRVSDHMNKRTGMMNYKPRIKPSDLDLLSQPLNLKTIDKHFLEPFFHLGVTWVRKYMREPADS
jgi:hypothetical protein